LKLSDITIKFATPEEMKNAAKGEKIRTEQEALKVAEEAKARIDKGEAFAKVAQDLSDDQPSKGRGGDLGAGSKNDKRLEPRGMGPGLEKAFELKVGEVAGPIKTDKGYHVITVTRGIEVEPFDEAKQSILMKTGNESRTELLAKLKKDSKIVYPEQEKLAAEAKKKAGDQPAPVKPAEAEAKPEAAVPVKQEAPAAGAPAK
jgi:parvulin-like peptidyl-prolyl isomerase